MATSASFFVRTASANGVFVKGSFGKIPVQVTLLYSMQPFGNRVQEIPSPQEKNFTMQWGWFYDDWYMVPPATFGKGHLSY